MGDITILSMEKFNIEVAMKIHNFFKRVKSHYYNALALLHNSKDKDLNSLIVAQIIVILMLVILLLIVNIGHQLLEL